MKHNCNFRSNPALMWGITMNALFQLLRYGFPNLLPDSLMSLLQGGVVGLLLVGLVMIDPRRAERICAWKRAHWKRG
jgi:hypothetical protein